MFLTALQRRGNVTEAARVAGISRERSYDWRSGDAEFARLWDNAIEEAIDGIEGEAHRRAVEGYDKPVIHEGKITTTYKAYSDVLMSILLRAHRPAKYIERAALELAGKGGKPILLRITPTDEKL
jgi:hypothetical protein